MQNIKKLKFLVVLTAILMIAGCARLTSIYREDDVETDQGQIILVDSKQRAITTQPNGKQRGKSGKVGESYAFYLCAEPSPDVFTAMATSLAGEASKSTAGDIGLKLSSSLAENASTIERTQTINLFRESMYRICERYMAGMISETELIVQAARDQRIMAAILAIEQITGVQKSQATALTTSAKAGIGGVTSEAVASLEKARKEYQDAKKVSDAKNEEATAADPAGLTCANAAKSEDPVPDSKKNPCAEAARADKKTADAKAHYDLVKKSVEKMSSVSTEASGQFHASSCCGHEASAEVAAHVVQIVDSINAFDEIEMTCVVLLRRLAEKEIRRDDIDDDFYGACVAKVSAQLKASAEAKNFEAAEMRLRAVRVEEKLESIKKQSRTDAQAVWDFILVDGNPDNDRLQLLLNKAGRAIPSRHRRELLDSASLEAFAIAFDLLTIDVQQALSKATQSE